MTKAPSTGLTQELPPLISYSSSEDLFRALRGGDPTALLDRERFDALIQTGLPPLVSPTATALILGVSPKLITAMAKSPSKYYRNFTIRKRSGGSRPISAPRTYLKAVQKFILKSVLMKQELPQCVVGFVKGRSIVQNASIHVGSRFLLNVDLKDFFGSVKIGRVREVFRDIGYSDQMARILAQLCTFNGSLPQGAPTSPCLANLAFREIDTQFERLSAEKSFRYSRYADDLSFSADTTINRSFVEELREILLPRGFKINEKKVRFARPGQAFYVTGFVTNEKVQPPRTIRRRLRAMFHKAEEDKSPTRLAKSARSLLGWASFVNCYDPKLGKTYLAVAERAVQSVESLSAKKGKLK